MTIHLTTDQKAIASGRLHDKEDALREALTLWERRERARAEILASIDVAEGALARGEGRMITPKIMRDLAAEVKQRGRARLAAGSILPTA